MKCLFILIIFLNSNIYSQDRSLIFTTGVPFGTCESSNTQCFTDADCLLGGSCIPPNSHLIENSESISTSLSDRFYINNNLALEAIKLYAQALTNPAPALIILQSDNEGLPGDELFSWELDVGLENHGNNYFTIVTTDECIYLDENKYYWITLHANDPTTQIEWFYSNNATFTYSTSNNLGETWNSPTIGNSGSLSVWAEFIYEPEIEDITGDINTDGSSNILDVVILSNAVLNDQILFEGDLNFDGTTNILDIVYLVSMILSGQDLIQLPSWDYIDINSNSNYYGQLIGPETFNGNVSLYYFGKGG